MRVIKMAKCLEVLEQYQVWKQAGLKQQRSRAITAAGVRSVVENAKNIGPPEDLERLCPR